MPEDKGMMQQNINYQKELEKIIAGFGDKRPQLLLHACCAPCSSYCLEYLREYFDITVFYYNPNISEQAEYDKRAAEEKRLIEEYNRRAAAGDHADMNSTEHAGMIRIAEAEYDPDRYYEAVRGLENEPEGGARCVKCFELRLRRSMEKAAELGSDYVTTTLTISPLKNASVLNGIGEKLAGEYGCRWLPSDFKKKGGFQRSIDLSHKFGLYRQNYCGCRFSRVSTEESKQ